MGSGAKKNVIFPRLYSKNMRKSDIKSYLFNMLKNLSIFLAQNIKFRIIIPITDRLKYRLELVGRKRYVPV